MIALLAALLAAPAPPPAPPAGAPWLRPAGVAAPAPLAASAPLVLSAPLAALAATPASAPVQGGGPGGDAQEEPVSPIQDIGDYYVLNFEEPTEGADEGLTLEQFVKICQEATGINFTYDRDTAQLLKNTKLLMFGTKQIPKGEFYEFFQIMMIINDFICSEVGPEHLSVIVVESLQTSARQSARNNAVYLQPENLARYADQPAVLVTTVLNLPNTDVRTLSNSLRTMLTDANTQQIIPVGSSNSVILTGFGSNVAALAKMLEFVDEAAAEDTLIVPEFEVIPLEFASAEEIADTVEELLDASRRAVQGATRGQPQQGPTGQLQTGQTETKIMVDPRTNSLLVMAMPEDMPRIKELVARLDVKIVERERNYHIVALSNVDAEAVAEVLDDFLQDAVRVQPGGPGGAPAGQRAGGTGGSTGSSRDFVVVPDPGTNSLLIAATRTHYEEVLDLVTRLDQRQDQVLIETALVELSGSDILDLGIEIGGANIPGADGSGEFGVTSFGLSTFADNDGDGIPDVKVPNISSGITAGILDGDDFNLPVLLKAMQERRNTNVLNVPSVLVNNNSSATVRTLDEQPTTQITATGGVGGQTQENFAGYEEAGITLQISPSISASRYLRLSISLEVSTFLGTFQGAIPPPRITRTIETTVNVPDGDTMVIGGIITDNKSDTTNQVPFLGDIPILGRLFRRDTDSLDRTTLYFFVTPHILHDPDFADLAEISYRKKLDAADIIGADRLRVIDPDFNTDPSSRGLGGFDVPLYRGPDRGEIDGREVGMDQARINELLRDLGELQEQMTEPPPPGPDEMDGEIDEELDGPVGDEGGELPPVAPPDELQGEGGGEGGN